MRSPSTATAFRRSRSWVPAPVVLRRHPPCSPISPTSRAASACSRPAERLRATEKAPMERHEGGYYIRLMARDLAGTAATIATRLAEQKISIESIVQRHPNGVDAAGTKGKASPVPVILITYATSEDAVYRALQAVQRDKVISGRPQVIRIEKN